MDPTANVNEALDLARTIIGVIDEQTDDDGTLPDYVLVNLAHDANRLAELVQAQHEWRSKGGFDPYSPEARDPGWHKPGEVREHAITINIREPLDSGAGYITAEWAGELPWEEMLELGPETSVTVDYERKEIQ